MIKFNLDGKDAKGFDLKENIVGYSLKDKDAPTDLILNKEGFLIKGSFFESLDGVSKNDFFGKLFDHKMMSFWFDEARYMIATRLIETPLSPITDFMLFDGVYGRFYSDEFYLVNHTPEILDRQQTYLDSQKIKKKQFGMFLIKPSQADIETIKIRSLFGGEAEVSAFAASIYLTLMTIEYCYSYVQNNDKVLSLLATNRDFLFDLILALDDSDVKALYNLLD